jgi:putative transposase
MPDHAHIIWAIPSKPGISKIMQLLKGRTSKEILGNLRKSDDFDIRTISLSNGSQALWKRRFYDFNLTSEGKLNEKLDYIHNNPVRWGLVTKPEDWPYSSFRCWYDLPGALLKVDKK